jgi:hypothetical protein
VAGAPPPTYFSWNQYSFQVPAGYVGVPGETAVDGTPLGHFIIYSARHLDVSRVAHSSPQTVPSYCTATSQTPNIHGAPARMYECSESSNGSSVELDLGHELLVWTQAGVTCEVSIHGHSRVNQQLDIAIAQSTSMISPSA